MSTDDVTSIPKLKDLRFDPSYGTSVPGVIKVGEASSSLVGFITVQTITNADVYGISGGWYSFVSMIGFLIPVIILLCYVFHVVEKLQWKPWLKAETMFAGFMCVLFLTAIGVAASKSRLDAAWAIATFFGLVAMVLFGYDAYLKYHSVKAGDEAQGENQSIEQIGSVSFPGL